MEILSTELITQKYINEISYKVIGCAIEVHKHLGPGAVEQMIPLFKAQLLSYLKLTGKPKGLLINFHSENIREQLVSLVTEEFARLPKE